jgi:hypothetical protein
MTLPVLSRASLLVTGFSLVLLACSSKDDPKAKADAAAPGSDAAATDGGASSIACYIADQFRCKEFAEATDDQRANLPVECSSTSGVLSSPANCPKEQYAGKCTLGTGKGQEIRRVYTGADVAYEADFCVNTALGVWSTAF